MSDPRVSILMPVLNVETWLEGAIRSVAEQDYASLELLIGDDGSERSDAALPFLVKYLPGRSVLYRYTHRGIASVLNELASRANGDLFMFMGADDTIPPGFIADAVETLTVYTDRTVACPIIQECRSVSDPEASIWAPDFALDRLHLENCIPGPSVFRRELWDAVPWIKGFEDTGCEDWARWVLLNRSGLLRPVAMHEIYYHRIRDGGLSNAMAQNLPAIRAKILKLHEHGTLA